MSIGLSKVVTRYKNLKLKSYVFDIVNVMFLLYLFCFLNQSIVIIGNIEPPKELIGAILNFIWRSSPILFIYLLFREGANKRGNSSRLTQSFHFFMFEPIFSPVNALNQPI